jgi:hypothetical protein
MSMQFFILEFFFHVIEHDNCSIYSLSLVYYHESNFIPIIEIINHFPLINNIQIVMIIKHQFA